MMFDSAISAKTQVVKVKFENMEIMVMKDGRYVLRGVEDLKDVFWILKKIKDMLKPIIICKKCGKNFEKCISSDCGELKKVLY